MAARCPRCREGKLFSGYLEVAQECSACGLDLRAHDSGDGPAVFLIFLLGAVGVGGAIWVETAFEPPYWLHLVLWPVVILGLALALLRPLKAKFIEIQYRRRSTAL